MKKKKTDKIFLPTRIYLILFQFISLLPLPFIMLSTSSHSIYDGKGILGVLCSLGISSLPRAEALGISYVYRLVLSELAVYFLLLIIAVIFGFVMKKLISSSDRCARITLTIVACLIFTDILIRFLPVRFNTLFGPVYWAVSILIRAAFLILVLTDLFKSFKKTSEADPADKIAEEHETPDETDDSDDVESEVDTPDESYEADEETTEPEEEEPKPSDAVETN
ncbi:MAG: hypothetical protein IJT70_04930 [Clostridia bacterium]|nr:hypothetical protein [Clostridia bacterium]